MARAADETTLATGPEAPPGSDQGTATSQKGLARPGGEQRGIEATLTNRANRGLPSSTALSSANKEERPGATRVTARSVRAATRAGQGIETLDFPESTVKVDVCMPPEVEDADSDTERAVLQPPKETGAGNALPAWEREFDTRMAAWIVAILDELGTDSATGSTVELIIISLERAEVTPAEMSDILDRLPEDTLGALLRLVAVKRFRDYLKQKGVPWSYIRDHWRPHLNDIGALCAGFTLGAGKGYVEFVITGSPPYMFASIFHFELELIAHPVRRTRELFEQLRVFAENPAANVIKMLTQEALELYHAFRAAWAELRMFEAGVALGNFAAVVVPMLVAAAEAGARTAVIGAKAALKAGQVAAGEIGKARVTVGRIGELLKTEPAYLATPDGMVFAAAGEDVRITDATGSTVGNISKGEIEGTKAATPAPSKHEAPAKKSAKPELEKKKKRRGRQIPKWILETPQTASDFEASLLGYQVYLIKDERGTVMYVGKGGGKEGNPPSKWIDRIHEHIKDPQKREWRGIADEIEVYSDLSHNESFALEFYETHSHRETVANVKNRITPDDYRVECKMGDLDVDIGWALKKRSYVFKVDIPP